MSGEIWDLQSDVNGLRQDCDNLLAANESLRQELADLKGYFLKLRDRVDAGEMVPA